MSAESTVEQTLSSSCTPPLDHHECLDDLDVPLADLLDEAIAEKGLTLQQVAESAHCSIAMVSKVAAGKLLPSESIVRNLDRALGTGSRLSDRAIVERAMRDRPRLRIPSLSPPAPPWLVGRQSVVARLTAALTSRQRSPVLVITGGPGVGKTAVACSIAHSVRNSFPHGVLAIDLCGHHPQHSPVDPTHILHQWLIALGIPENDLPERFEDRRNLFRTLLDRRRMLILLEDTSSDDQVRQLLPAAPGSAVLITSRHRLSTAAVWGRAEHHTLAPLSHQHSKDLLTRLTAASPDLHITDDTDHLDRIVTHCAGLPMALTAAAELIHTYGLTTAVDMLDWEPLAMLDHVAAHSLSQALSTSWHSLSAQAQALLTALAHSPATTAVPGDTALTELLHHHLVTISDAGERYTLNPLTAAYIRTHHPTTTRHITTAAA